MKLEESEIAFLEEYIPELAAAAVTLAFWQALSSGKSVLISENGELREVSPNGEFKIIEQSSSFIKVEKGLVIRLK